MGMFGTSFRRMPVKRSPSSSEVSRLSVWSWSYWSKLRWLKFMACHCGSVRPNESAILSSLIVHHEHSGSVLAVRAGDFGAVKKAAGVGPRGSRVSTSACRPARPPSFDLTYYVTPRGVYVTLRECGHAMAYY